MALVFSWFQNQNNAIGYDDNSNIFNKFDNLSDGMDLSDFMGFDNSNGFNKPIGHHILIKLIKAAFKLADMVVIAIRCIEISYLKLDPGLTTNSIFSIAF